MEILEVKKEVWSVYWTVLRTWARNNMLQKCWYLSVPSVTTHVSPSNLIWTPLHSDLFILVTSPSLSVVCDQLKDLKLVHKGFLSWVPLLDFTDVQSSTDDVVTSMNVVSALQTLCNFAATPDRLVWVPNAPNKPTDLYFSVKWPATFVPPYYKQFCLSTTNSPPSILCIN